jgi:hypothetical protein
MVLRVALTDAGGKTLWQRENAIRMRSFGSVQQGNAQEQLQKEMASSFKSVVSSTGAMTKSMPYYLFKDLSEILAGESDLGFKQELPPPTKKAPSDGSSPPMP